MFNEKAEKLACSNGRFRSRCWILSRHWSSYPRFMVNDMLLIAASMIGGFIFAALLTDGSIDDDDDMDGGMMIPAYQPNA